jgi:hypothetical protein
MKGWNMGSQGIGRILRSAILGAFLSIGSLFATTTLFAAEVSLSKGQTIYVPAYSYVRIGEKGHQFELAANLCIRNTDPHRAITISSVDYHNTDGALLKMFLEKTIELKPLAATDFFVKTSDVTGGFAPSFIIKWRSPKPVSPPITECVMIGDRSGLGVSIILNGKVIKEVDESH